MNRPLVLVVEDNTITAKMLQVALQSSQYRVLVAHDAATALRLVAEARPDLILQDLLLPDMDGVDLLRRTREIPSAHHTPVVVCSGLLSKIEEARGALAPFTDYLFKPVDVGQLLQVVRRLLPELQEGEPTQQPRARVLLIDDDLVQLKLNALQLRSAGYSVDVAGSAAEGIARAERNAPDVFVIDLLMPDLSGFELCVQIRQHALLGGIPVIIASATYSVLSEPDQALAKQMGANSLVSRTPSLDLVLASLQNVLHSSGVPQVSAGAESLHDEFQAKLGVQLERQVALSNSLTRRVALDSTLLAVITGAASLVNEQRDLHDVIRDVLAHTLDAGGVSSGAVFLCEQESPVLYAHLGFTQDKLPELNTLFGHSELLYKVARGGTALLLDPNDFAYVGAPDLPERSGMPAVVIEPLQVRGKVVGVLMIGASRFQSMQEWVDTIRSIGSQLAQAIVLSQTLDALRSSEDNFRQLFEANPYPMLVLEASALTILASNAAAREFFERSADEFQQTSLEALIDGADAKTKRFVNMLAGTDKVAHRSAARYQQRSGGFSELELSWRSVQFTGQAAHILIVHDVTAREFLQQQMVQAQKMEAVGLLAGGVAHDFNNLLTVIKSCGSILMEDLATEDSRREDVVEIVAAAERAAVLTRQLLAFSRRQVLDPKPVAVRNVVLDLERMLRRLIPASIDFDLSLDANTGSVVVDAGQFEQVVVNLVVNARDAMPHGGPLHIATSNVTVPELTTEENAHGSYVLLEIADAGTGMDDATRARIFEPFFSTKPRGQGTGLGLSTVYGIVNQSGGHIRVITAPGNGTTFQVYFPRIEQPELRSTPLRMPSVTTVGHERILVVEDEEAVRRIVCRTLTALGYTTIEARNGEEALELAKSIDVAPGLLLSDVVMPRMNGLELTEHLHKVWPELRVLFMSGYSDLPAGQTIPVDYAFIQKPFLPVELAARVRQEFDRARKPTW